MREPDLVGRRGALGLLSAATDAARTGRPQVGMIIGAAGSGKTSLLQEHLRSLDGSVVLYAAGFEQLDVPFLPVLDLVRQLAPYERVDDVVGSAIESIRRLSDEPGSPVALAAGRTEFMTSVEDAFRALARRSLVTVVVDDLHWVDDASLALLQHLAVSLGLGRITEPVQLLLLFASRPEGVAPARRSVVERLSHQRHVWRVELGALSAPEARAIIEGRTGQAPSMPVLELLLESSGGNPLHLVESIDRLQRDGSFTGTHGFLRLRPGAALASAPSAAGGFTDALASMRPAVRQVLRLAALSGERIDRELVHPQVGDVDLDAMFAEAIEARVLDVDGRRFRHPLLRAALADELDPADRRRAHAEFAGHAAFRAGTSEDAAGRARDLLLAGSHLLAAGSDVDGELVHAVAADAARVSFNAGAWAGAAALFERAAAAAVDPQVARTHRAGRVQALHRAHDFPTCVDEGRRVVADAVAANDVRNWASALLPSLRARFSHGRGRAAIDECDRELAAFLEAAGAAEPELRARALEQRAELAVNARRFDEAMRFADDAVELATGRAPDVGVQALASAGLGALGLLELSRSRAVFDRALALATSADDPWLLGWCHFRRPLIEWIDGDLDTADQAGRTSRELAEQTGNWSEASFSAACLAGVMLARGEVEACLEWAETALLEHRLSDFAWTPGILHPVLVSHAVLTGDEHAVGRAVDRWAEVDERSARSARAHADALLERLRSGSETPVIVRNSWTVDLFSLPTVACAAESRYDLAAIEALRHRVGQARFAHGWGQSVQRLAARSVRDPVLRAEELARVVSDLDRRGARVEAARARVDLAASLRAAGDAAAADAPLLVAGDTFDQIGATSHLRHVEGRLARARPSRHRPRAQRSRGLGDGHRWRIICFTDIAGSTDLNRRLGDDRWLLELSRATATIRSSITRWRGVEFKHTGDGLAAWFDDADDAAQAGLEMIEEIDALPPTAAGPLSLYVGLAAGSPLVAEEDLFGLSVATAARLCDAAEPSEVLVTEEVAGACRAVEVVDAGERELKGLDGPVPVYRVVPRDGFLDDSAATSR